MNPFRVIEDLKNRAAQVMQSSVLYDWSLSESAPDRLVIRPVDPWKGDGQRAAALMEAADVTEETGAHWEDHWWEPDTADEAWISHMHGFEWLRDLRTKGGRLACRQGQFMIENWLACYGSWDKVAWRSDLTGRRLAMWISHYEYFCAGIDEVFEDNVLAAIVKQARHLSNALGRVQDIGYFHAAKGLLYAGLAIEGRERWVAQALNGLEKALERQVQADGMHVTRNAAKTLDVLEVLVDIKGALRAGDYPVPHFLEEMIQEMSNAVRFFRCGDRRLSTLQGTQEGDSGRIDSILAQAGARGKVRDSLPYSGFEKVSLGPALLLLDVGRSPDYPFDEDAHASPLAFEFCYGKERLFVSCGSNPVSKQWNEALRFTAAHNTVCLDHRNACEIRKDGHFGRKVTKFLLEREEMRDAVLIQASHNGYEPLNGITHTRKFYLSGEGNDLRGEDNFTSAITLVRPVNIAMRFHLHPNIVVTRTLDAREALLRMPGGIGWRFHVSGGDLCVEDSVYMGSGTQPRKTRQLVIQRIMNGGPAQVKWSLKREG